MAVDGAVRELSRQHGRSPSAADVARVLELSEEEVLEAMEAASAYEAISLESHRYGGDTEEGATYAERVGEEDGRFELVEYEASLAPVLRALPERDPHPALYDTLAVLVDHLDDPDLAPALFVRFELAILAELGFGLDLSECAATGATEDLAFVSPRSGRAVSAAAAQAYRDRLFPLPKLLLGPGAADWPEILAGLRITGHFLARDLLIERQSEVLAARERLVERLKRIGG